MFDIKDYEYYLPSELIAQDPLADRDKSRLMVVYRDKGRWEDKFFFNLPQFIRPGDLLVVNNSRVVPARLYGRKETGGRV